MARKPRASAWLSINCGKNLRPILRVPSTLSRSLGSATVFSLLARTWPSPAHAKDDAKSISGDGWRPNPDSDSAQEPARAAHREIQTVCLTYAFQPALELPLPSFRALSRLAAFEIPPPPVKSPGPGPSLML